MNGLERLEPRMTDLPTDIRGTRHKEAARVLDHLSTAHRRERVIWADLAKRLGTGAQRIGGMMERPAAPRGA
jgi:hypothetical protein